MLCQRGQAAKSLAPRAPSPNSAMSNVPTRACSPAMHTRAASCVHRRRGEDSITLAATSFLQHHPPVGALHSCNTAWQRAAASATQAFLYILGRARWDAIADGRHRLVDQKRLAPWLPESKALDVYGLGPNSFIKSITQHLKTLGVPAAQTQHEFFEPNAALENILCVKARLPAPLTRSALKPALLNAQSKNPLILPNQGVFN